MKRRRFREKSYYVEEEIWNDIEDKH